MSDFQTIGVIAKQGDAALADTLVRLLSHLGERGREVVLDASAAELLPGRRGEGVGREEIAARCDLAVVVGGDGTLLNAGRSLADAEVPILGVNQGRLGFLVDVSPEEMTARLDEILQGRFLEEPRTLLRATVERAGRPIHTAEALNDVVIHIRDVVRMIEFDTYIDGRFVNTQRADGLIVSTPTGSTAYALSGGGPILHPGLDALVLVPICPHTLSHRPIVVDVERSIEVAICAQNTAPAQVAFDGQSSLDLEPEDRVRIVRAPHRLRLIHPQGYDFFHILRAKLRWSEQP